MDVANISADWEVIDRVPSCTQCHFSYKLLTMKVNSPIRPRVPVAAHWQQSDRGEKNVPDDSLPIPQVPISTPKRTKPAEEAAQKTPKHSSNSKTSKSRYNAKTGTAKDTSKEQCLRSVSTRSGISPTKDKLPT